MEVNMTNISTFLNNAIGFEDMFNRFDYLTSINSGFPHYNIRKENEGKYVIELALAGYKKDEVSVEVKDGILIIEGNQKKIYLTMYIKVLLRDRLKDNFN